MSNQVSSFIKNIIPHVHNAAEAAIVTGGSLPGSCLYFAGRLASIYTLKITNAWKVLELPSYIYNTISNSLPTSAQKICSKVKILVPIVGIAASTAIASYGYNAVSMWAIKGIIAGVHSIAVGLFSTVSAKATIISLRNCVSNSTSTSVDIFSNTVFITTSLSLTILTLNPILALTVASPVSAVVRVANDYFTADRETSKAKGNIRN